VKHPTTTKSKHIAPSVNNICY